MADKLRLQLFGQPKVFLEEKEVQFSFVKIEALLYYLAVMGQVNRDQVAGLLWAGKGNQVARKNLRNTVYQANRVLGDDVIISPTRNSLALNPQLAISSDLELFSQAPLEFLELYQGDFLAGFYLKDDDEFEDWLARKRLAYQQLYENSCQQVIQSLHPKDPKLEGYLRRLIDLDEFEERNYELLLSYYRRKKQFGKFFESYYGLVDLLDRELGVAPSEAIESLYQAVLSERRGLDAEKKGQEQALPFFGRRSELRVLEDYLGRLEEAETASLFLLEGDFGVGKRRLLRQVLLMRHYAFGHLRLDCSRRVSQGSGHFLQLLEDGLSQVLPQMQPVALSAEQSMESLLASLRLLLQQQPLLLIVEEVQCLEAGDLVLLERVLDQLGQERLGVILTATPQQPSWLQSYLTGLDLKGQVSRLRLAPFSPKASRAFLADQLPMLEEARLTELVDLSQGNAFILTAYVQDWREGTDISPLPRLVKSHLSHIWGQLDGEEMDLLNLLSCYRKACSFSHLGPLVACDCLRLTDLLDQLGEKGILAMREEGDVLLLDFHQQVMKRFVYQGLSPAKKRLLHREIAQNLERDLEQGEDLALYKEIAYQYKQAKEGLLALSYEMHYLEAILQFKQELFPIYYKGYQAMEEADLERPMDILPQLDYLERELTAADKSYQQDRSYRLLRLRFLYLKGRYSIRIGDYQEGIHHVLQVISIAGEMELFDLLLEGYRQMIYYSIQTQNLEEMDYYTDLALETAVENNDHEAIALHLRLKGVYFLMMGDEEQATRYLYRSIDCFSLTPSLQAKYPIQIAAALDYLAEIEQVRGNYRVALAHQEEALQLVARKNMEALSTIFSIGQGISYYLMGDSHQAAETLEQASQVLSRLSFPWKEAQLELYLALLALEKGEESKLAAFLSKKDSLINRYGNPRDKGLVYYLLALLAYKKVAEPQALPGLKDQISEDFASYAKVAKQHLNPYRDKHFVKKLDALATDLKARGAELGS